MHFILRALLLEMPIEEHMLENSVLDLDTTQREENASNLYTADAEAMKTTSNHETSARGDASTY
ncbi:unnamed protein product [Heligmosomoides polygyrus]|uniref:Uncharacterized protein n=1 Tax=Heligmosomoides polygyrus TaxID=6339 RepID=A0A3P8ETC7_HELPZ|nr:unnamed protein product [Heligmosomoides polygyrus]